LRTGDGGLVEGDGVFVHGTTVTLTATPNTGYVFVVWFSGDRLISSDATHTITAESDVVFDARFNYNRCTACENWGEWIESVAPTCGVEGIEKRECSDCDHGYQEQPIPATGEHRFRSWTTITTATCIEPGLRERTCRNCDDVEIDSIPATGYIMGSGNRAGTCTICGFRRLGDVNGDGSVTVQDALQILRFIVGLSSVIRPNTPAWTAALIADANAARPSVSDALQILRFVVRLPSPRLDAAWGRR
jgi:hypothetical protein